MEWCPPLHLGVVAIEKGAFGSPLTKIASCTYFIYEKSWNKSSQLVNELVGQTVPVWVQRQLRRGTSLWVGLGPWRRNEVCIHASHLLKIKPSASLGTWHISFIQSVRCCYILQYITLIILLIIVIGLNTYGFMYSSSIQIILNLFDPLMRL